MNSDSLQRLIGAGGESSGERPATAYARFLQQQQHELLQASRSSSTSQSVLIDALLRERLRLQAQPPLQQLRAPPPPIYTTSHAEEELLRRVRLSQLQQEGSSWASLPSPLLNSTTHQDDIPLAFAREQQQHQPQEQERDLVAEQRRQEIQQQLLEAQQLSLLTRGMPLQDPRLKKAVDELESSETSVAAGRRARMLEIHNQTMGATTLLNNNIGNNILYGSRHDPSSNVAEILAAALSQHNNQTNHVKDKSTETRTVTDTFDIDWDELIRESPFLDPEMRTLVSDLTFFCCAQMKPCALTPEDRVGMFKTRGAGFPGLCCRCCEGTPGFGRYFPGTLKGFATGGVIKSIKVHLLEECRQCPKMLQEKIRQLELYEEANPPPYMRGARRQFFVKIWNKLHENYPAKQGDGSAGAAEGLAETSQRSGNGQDQAVAARDGNDDKFPWDRLLEDSKVVDTTDRDLVPDSILVAVAQVHSFAYCLHLLTPLFAALNLFFSLFAFVFSTCCRPVPVASRKKIESEGAGTTKSVPSDSVANTAAVSHGDALLFHDALYCAIGSSCGTSNLFFLYLLFGHPGRKSWLVSIQVDFRCLLFLFGFRLLIILFFDFAIVISPATVDTSRPIFTPSAKWKSASKLLGT